VLAFPGGLPPSGIERYPCLTFFAHGIAAACSFHSAAKVRTAPADPLELGREAELLALLADHPQARVQPMLELAGA
jgi:hypothetical protein